MPKLGKLLVQRGWATPREVESALKVQRTTGGRLGTCLLENNTISEDLLAKALSEQHRVPAVGVEDLRHLEEEVLETLPAKVAIRCRAIPIRVFKTQVHIAMADPRDLDLQDQLSFAIGRRIKVHVAANIRIAEALERYYGEPCPARLSGLLDRLNRARYLWRREEEEEPSEGRTPSPGTRDASLPTRLGDIHLPGQRSGPAASTRPELSRPASPRPRAPTGVAPASAARLTPPPMRLEGTAPQGEGPSEPLPEEPLSEESLPEKTLSERASWEQPEASLFASPTAPAAPRRPPEAPPLPPPPPASPSPEPRPAPPEDPGAASEGANPFTIALSDQELALLTSGGSEETEGEGPDGDRPGHDDPGDATQPLPADAPPGSWTFPEAEARLGHCQDPEEIADTLIRFLGAKFRRVALFKVLRDRIAGWTGVGFALDEACLARFEADFEQPSLFLNLRQGGSFYLGPLPPMAVHRALARCWGDDLPDECLILPVRIRGRLVTAIYLDRGPEGLQRLDLDALQQLTLAVGEAYERCILRKRGETAR